MDAARIVYRRPTGLTVDIARMRGPDIVTDLGARDFSINAMAVNVRDWDESQPGVLDPCGGQGDLAAGILRATSDGAFQSDPLRMMRAVRFMATLGFRLESQTESWIRRDAHLITGPSPERVRYELALILASRGAAAHLRRLDDLGLMRGILPEVVALKGVTQSAPHVYDVYEHTLATAAQAERLSTFPDAQLGPDETQFLGPFAADLDAHFHKAISENRTRAMLLKFAALLHDVGKPQTRTVEPGGRTRFVGHERVSADTTAGVLTRLRFTTQEIRLVSAMVTHHTRPGLLLKEPSVTPRLIYRFFRATGDVGSDVLILALADQLATRGETLRRDHWLDYLGLVRGMLDHYFRRPHEVVAPPRLVSGRDAMALLGLGPGPRVGELLEAVREAQAEGQVLTREQAMNFLRRFSE
jgi:tRNA nucleotidyltransferase/poly(A) polymerase